MERLLGLDEALKLTGYRSRTTLRRLIAKGELAVVRLSSRTIRIREQDLKAFIETRAAAVSRDAECAK